MKKAAVVTWGRLNPPTSGHQKVIDKVKALAKKQGAMPHVYLSHSKDSNRNPLDYNTKINFAKKAFGPSVTKSNARTIIEVLKELQAMGHTEVTLLVGSDRVREFKKLTSTYNGKDFTFNKINVVSAGARDPDAENISGMSATKMRAAAKLGDYKSFKSGTPSTMSERDKKAMYDKIRSVVEHVSEKTEFKDEDFEFTDEELDVFIDAISDLDSLDGEISEEFDEILDLEEWKKPLSVAQRIKRGRLMKRLAPRMKRKREIQKKRMADLPRLQRRSRKAALRIIRKRFAGKQGQNYTKLSHSAKLSVDRIIQRHLPRVAKLSTRLLPRIRKAEVQRLQRARGGSAPVKKDKAPMMASYTVDDQFKDYLKENFEEPIIIFEKEDEEDDSNTKLMVMLRQAFRDPKERMLVIRALKGGAKSLQNPKLRPFILKLLNRLLDATQNDTSMFTKMKDKLRRMGQEDDKKKREKDANESFKTYMSLSDKADKADIPLDIIIEIYNREEDSTKGFDRVNSYIAGGAAKELDNDIQESYEKRVIEVLKKKMITGHFKNGKLHVDKTDMKDARLIISKDPVIHKIPTVIGESGLRYDARKPSSQKNKLSSRLDSVRKTQSKISSPAKIKTEYKAFNKLSIKQLRDIVGRSHRTADLKGYDKSLAISTILRDKFGDKAVKQAFGLKKEEVELDERLKFEGKFKKGDTIKSFDHRSSEKYYIIGKITGTEMRQGAKVYVIKVINDSGKTSGRRVGNTSYVPMGMSNDYNGRIIKEDAIDMATARISKQKKASAQRHDSIMDRARIKKARNKVRKARRTNQTTESVDIQFEDFIKNV